MPALALTDCSNVCAPAPNDNMSVAEGRLTQVPTGSGSRRCGSKPFTHGLRPGLQKELNSIARCDLSMSK
jgi:hypothetical protein